MLERTVMIDGVERKMKASALIPRLYRRHFGRDMMRDMAQLSKNYKAASAIPEDALDEEKAAAAFDVPDLEIFENVAWLFLRHAGEDIPDTPDEWLESIEGVFSIYEIMPIVLELWGDNQKTTSTPKKK